MHLPVLTKEVMEYLDVQPNRNYIDATAGEGGHSKEILKRNRPTGQVLAIELDSQLAEKLKQQNIARLKVVNDTYTNIENIIVKENFKPVHGILADLGMASWHLQESGRGFSFQKDEPLDMRYSRKQGLRAADIINAWPEEEIARILNDYGQERFARRIAKAITAERAKQAIQTTLQLVEILRKVLPMRYQHQRINFATRTFQALRITVNKELENLKIFLPQAVRVLTTQGRLALISFHSLEERIVKNFFREQEKQGHLKILTKKPIQPGLAEIKNNPSARSAKLRAAYRPNSKPFIANI